MTTRKEFQEWLNRFPEDTIIQVAIQSRPYGYDSNGPVGFESPKLEDSDYGKGWGFTDFSKNNMIKKESEYYGKKYLELGERY